MRREEFFKRALKVQVEEIRAELTCETVRELTDAVWCELREETQILISSSEFYEIVKKEAEKRQWDLKFYRNNKDETVLNLFKKVIREVCRDKNIPLSNNQLSRVLNKVRMFYADDAMLSAGLYPAEAFRERSRYGIPLDLGDIGTCFRIGGGNEGNALWLIEDDKRYGRVKFIVFHYESDSKIGKGRCWALFLPGAVYVTNFYSSRFEIRDKRFKRPLVRLISKLFGLSEHVEYVTELYSPLPIHQNGDSILIYEPSRYEDPLSIFGEISQLYSVCLWCLEEVRVYHLMKYDGSVYYPPLEAKIGGLVICGRCADRLESWVECIDCGRLFDPSEAAAHVVGRGYLCRRCFEERWFCCSKCGMLYPNEDGTVTPDGVRLCRDCASKLGMVCEVCGEFHYFVHESISKYTIEREVGYTDVYVCNTCARKHLYEYQCQCGREVVFLDTDFLSNEKLRDRILVRLCYDCYYERIRNAYSYAFENEVHPSLFTYSADPAERILREILFIG